MKVVLNNITYFVDFKHVQEGVTETRNLAGGIKSPSTLVRHTECKILQPIEGKEMPGFISIGYARCHPEDNFVKETGRQISLDEALKDGIFAKEERAVFWEAYRKHGQPEGQSRF